MAAPVPFLRELINKLLIKVINEFTGRDCIWNPLAVCVAVFPICV